jgi:hypothetical protein
MDWGPGGYDEFAILNPIKIANSNSNVNGICISVFPCTFFLAHWGSEMHTLHLDVPQLLMSSIIARRIQSSKS